MSEKMSYEEFKSRIERQLRQNPDGLTWTEIREKAGLYQKWPNNRWVRRLEQDIRLIRATVKGKLIWRLE